ncbi:MAG: hypothetical protein H8E66_34560 [Planctomycetes bacterium]|nr:hypothetical protein [Planctomycetota bacterium]
MKSQTQYAAGARKDVFAWRKEKGGCPPGGSFAGKGKQCGTPYAPLLLPVNDVRLSIYNRRSPKLPRDDAGP